MDTINVSSRDEPKTLADIIAQGLGKNASDMVNAPPHYRAHPSGVECIQITEHMNFCLGNAIKYIWRAGLKSKDPVEDLKKAKFYIEREIQRLEPKTNNYRPWNPLDYIKTKEDLDAYVKACQEQGREFE